jgi:NADH-quinone oxidoreductase subunit L
MDYSIALLVLLFPLVTFFVLGLLNQKLSQQIASIVGTISLLAITLISYGVAIKYFLNNQEPYPAIEAVKFLWLQWNGNLQIHLGIFIDPLSVMMLVVVTTVSLMVHIYSLGYMKGEDGFQRYYAFLSLFTFSMLGLVLSTNIFQLYIFWELVGVSSYLLIGFYYDRPSAVAASKKAFIITRFADFGFLIGILVLSYTTGTFDFSSLTDLNGAAINQPAGFAFLGLSSMTWALLLIFIGGAGKSAMFPLHIWLPDAMEGPTPVSALIHAATMVVAGVFLVARLFPLYSFAAPDMLEVIAYVGSFTSLFAAVIACTQVDIKRVLAYSTLSQIGYMMVALGVSGYGGEAGVGYMASLFHLFTHAFFKALLFLGAGSLIHAVHSNSMNDMGNLKKYLPITHITFLFACLSIAGIPPFAGFFSKDEILVAAYNNNLLIFYVQWIVAGITAFYMFRLYFSVFWNRDVAYEKAPDEAPATMTIPLIILAVASLLSGFVPFHQFVTSDGKSFETSFDIVIAIASVAIALLGIISAAVLYASANTKPQQLANQLRGLYTITVKKFYVDEIYLFITHKILFNMISQSIAWIDRTIVDGIINGTANSVMLISKMIKRMQSGQMQLYIWFFTAGVIVLAIVVMYLNHS